MHHLFGTVLASYDLAQGHQPITTPVLVILGRHDYRVPYTLWEAEQSKLPHVTTYVFERSGHTPQLEEPERFNYTVAERIDHLGV